ncbi:MAG TPA: CoA ester lyase [Albitalea sp.]|nr:CoA ester lyase [Albitalea sp.]
MTTPRSYLFVPGNRPERFDKALASGADAVVLDLEDAVSSEDKQRARDLVGQRLLDAPVGDRARLVVRINDESTPWFDDDVQMAQRTGALQVMLPKAERVATALKLRSACPGIAVLALIETARGVLAAESLASTEGVHRLVFGTIDFALDLDLSGDPIGLDHAASHLALASRAAGLAPPVAGVTPEIDDDTRLLADLARARAHGFGAKLCIHPKQVAAVHAALQPSAAELDWARRVIAAAAGTQDAVQVDGRMVDKPVLQRAHILLQRAAR